MKPAPPVIRTRIPLPKLVAIRLDLSAGTARAARSMSLPTSTTYQAVRSNASPMPGAGTNHRMRLASQHHASAWKPPCTFCRIPAPGESSIRDSADCFSSSARCTRTRTYPARLEEIPCYRRDGRHCRHLCHWRYSRRLPATRDAPWGRQNYLPPPNQPRSSALAGWQSSPRLHGRRAG